MRDSDRGRPEANGKLLEDKMARLQKLWAFLDVPSGSIMSVWSGSVILMSWIAFISQLMTGRPAGLSEGTVAAYTAALTAFAGTKVFGKKDPPAPTPVPA